MHLPHSASSNIVLIVIMLLMDALYAYRILKLPRKSFIIIFEVVAAFIIYSSIFSYFLRISFIRIFLLNIAMWLVSIKALLYWFNIRYRIERIKKRSAEK